MFPFGSFPFRRTVPSPSEQSDGTVQRNTGTVQRNARRSNGHTDRSIGPLERSDGTVQRIVPDPTSDETLP